jgi:hypothetical protein
MRQGSFASLFLAVGFLGGMLGLRQNTPSDGKRAAKQESTGSVTDVPSPAEKWTVLDDIHTGLQPRPPLKGERDEQPEFVRELVRVQWRVGDPIDLWIIRPKTTDKVPVILYMYSYPNEPAQFRDNGWCQRQSSGGYAAVGFVSALTGSRYHFRPMKQWFVSELPESVGSTVHDVQLVLNYLETRSDLDVDHVGMFGMGSGGTIAILAAAVDPRIKSIDVLDPWGYWPTWLRQSPFVPDNERAKYVTEEFLKSVEPIDPVRYLPKLKTPSVRMEQTLTDPVTPNVARQIMAGALPDLKDLVTYVNPEAHLKAWKVDGLSGWIKAQLHAQMQQQPRSDSVALSSGRH